MIDLKTIRKTPNPLARYYTRFRVGERLLFTGHSHQAWPDCGFDGQRQAWLDAADFVDDKWERAFAKADRVKNGFARLLDDTDGEIALAANTHDLVVRFLSALPLRRRPRLVTTDGEYHSIRRQVDRLAEEGIEVVKVAADPASSVCERLTQALDDRTAAVLVSSVFYQTGHIVPDLGEVLAACRGVGAALLVDAYHSLNVVPLSIVDDRLSGAFIVGGGYKYCQLGEGNCFLRIPADCDMRPIITGWFSEFSALAQGKKDADVVYGSGGDRFAGSTYDPTSHYRGAAVFDFFHEQQLSPRLLREISQHQIAALARAFDQLDTSPKVVRRDRDIPLDAIGGFLALQSPVAETLCAKLRDRGVLTDYRGELLRFGPAPYLSDDQLEQAMGILGELLE